mgnify:CR=1 FL=1
MLLEDYESRDVCLQEVMALIEELVKQIVISIVVNKKSSENSMDTI